MQSACTSARETSAAAVGPPRQDQGILEGSAGIIGQLELASGPFSSHTELRNIHR